MCRAQRLRNTIDSRGYNFPNTSTKRFAQLERALGHTVPHIRCWALADEALGADRFLCGGSDQRYAHISLSDRRYATRRTFMVTLVASSCLRGRGASILETTWRLTFRWRTTAEPRLS